MEPDEHFILHKYMSVTVSMSMIRKNRNSKTTMLWNSWSNIIMPSRYPSSDRAAQSEPRATPMVSFDVGVGARCDFGSLNAFLGVPQVSHEPHRDGTAKAGLGVPLSKVIKESVRTTEKSTPDSTLLKKKVAFRMLKQLGCEVRSNPESDTSFVEVSLAKQPVLFKMLVELGHGPCRNEEGTGDLVVRVKEQRPRKPEEVVAALSAPAKPKSVPEEGYPSIGRPRLRPEDEERLVKRLYVPSTKSKNAPPEKDNLGAKPRRTAAEQRAYLDRLSKPRETDRAADGPEEFRDVGALGFGNASSWSSQIAWPKFSSPTVASAKPKPKNRRTKGPSGPLVQAGQLLLCESPVELLEESESDKEDGDDDHNGYVGHDSECHFESVEPSVEPGHAEQSVSPDPVSPSNSHVPSSDLAGAERSEKFEDFVEEFENTEEWLNRLLGPLDMPKSKSCKPSSRLEELAKPRQLKERNDGGTPAPAPCRSPRSQREACARLSQPRRPKADSNEDGDVDLPDAFPEELESEEPPVQVIPSMLAQLASSPRLERIDEESPATGARRRNKSQKSATPYSVPVCLLPPPKKGASKSQVHSKQSAGFQKQVDAELMPEELEQLASFLDEAGQSEAMLDDIDALYSQLIAVAEDATNSSTNFQAAGNNSEFPEPQSKDEAPEEQKANLEGEDLLSAIDQLFHQMVPKGMEHDGTEPPAEESTEAPADVSGPEPDTVERRVSKSDELSAAETAAGHSSARQPPQAPPTDGNSDLPKLLEEILWSALLLVRAGQDAAQVVSALPVSQLKDSCCISPLPCSLQQRLAVELPDLSAVLSSNDASTSSTAVLLPCLRNARDNLLSFASEAKSRDPKEPSPLKLQRPPSATSPTDVAGDGKQAKRKHKVRRTSLSYWTEESLEKLEAPKAKTPKAPG